MNLDPVILAELMRGGPPLWVSGRTYPVGVVVRSPGNLQTYVRVTAGAGNADPSGGDANWMILSRRVEDAVTAVRDSLSAARTEAGMWRDDVKTAVVNARDHVNGNVYAVRDQVQATVINAKDIVWAKVAECSAMVLAVKDIVAYNKTLAEGSGIKGVQRGVFGGIQMNVYQSFYEIPISHVNPAKAEVRLLTVFDLNRWPTGNGSIALAASGNGVQVGLRSDNSAGSYFPPCSWEVTEWK
ncbi:hypothetical protein [Paracidovorax citrulli]|uniref:hypothetical protein n=1 Tax=Paracidovorax citrulli TaxID=80869 RepID=UPI0005FB65FE|nr:hypothetical protein [Paracidovorax citrulli]